MNKTLRILLLFLLGIVYVSLINIFITNFKADRAYKRAQNSFDKNDINNAYQNIEKALTLNPNESTYYRERAKVLLALSLNTSSKDNRVLKDLALKDLDKSIALNPNNLVASRNATAIYYFLSVEDLTKEQSKDNLDQDYIKHILKHLNTLETKYKNDLGVQILIAKHEKKLGLENKYLATLENIKQLRPDILEWHPDLIN